MIIIYGYEVVQKLPSKTKTIPYILQRKGQKEVQGEREGGRGRDRGDGEKQHDLLERETQLP